MQSFLRSKIPAAFESYEPDVDAGFRRIHRELLRGLADDDAKRRQQAEILLALSLTWLASQRSINVVGTLELLREMFTGTDASTHEIVRKALAEGKLGALKRTAAIATLLGGALRDSRTSLEAERQRRASVEAQLTDAKKQIAALTGQIDALTQQRDQLTTEAAKAAKELEEGRQHAGHDIVDLKAKQTAFLRRRITPLLNDAVDALEIESPAPEIAIARLKSAIDAIGDATG